jgi:ABC-type Fe3+/spermidine/putrescine transport system ATPase subunit
MTEAGTSPCLEVRHLAKAFDGAVAVRDLSLTLERGRLLALLGPSGSGKTTTLRLLAGFESPESGQVLIDGEDVTRQNPVTRRCGMVFQHFALFPHLDVGRNVAFGLESRGIRGGERDRRVAEALALVEMAGFERRRVDQLSGGQQQRVALARALAPEPRILLLDEPLSNLDPALRERTRGELRALLHRIGITAVLVTHEQEEAFDLGDLTAVLREGRLEQLGPPEELYARPASAFVAGFIGQGSALPVSILASDSGRTRVALQGIEWWVESPTPEHGASRGATLFLRPEAVALTSASDEVPSGEVVARRFTGAITLYRVSVPGGVIEVAAEAAAARVGDRVGVRLRERAAGVHLFADDA